jgi:hypothetical protein
MAEAQLPAWYRAWDAPGGWWHHPRYHEALRVFEHHTPEKRIVAEYLVNYGISEFGDRPRHLIDFGSGLAAAPLALAERGWTVTLADVDATKVAALAARLRPPSRAVCVDLLNPGDAFAGEPAAALVCMTHFLYHIPRPKWPQLFPLALSLCGDGGRVLVVMRSPAEAVNRWCASLGGPLIDVESDARAWAGTSGATVGAAELPMSMGGLTREQARIIIEVMIRATVEPGPTARIPDESEIERKIETELFRGDRCIWPYANAVVTISR